MDESTDVAGLEILLVFVRYSTEEKAIQEDMIILKLYAAKQQVKKYLK